MQHISVLIKPASSACNMKCAYCFYEDVANSREQEFQGFLREEQMEQVIVEAMKLAERSCSFLFQGGEPTLAGLSFYESVIRLQKKHRKDGVLIYNSIQTNGYHLTEDMIRFFVRERFLIGVSLDGPEQVHDLYRTGRSGGGTFREVMETIALLKRFRADYNVLCVVTEESAKRGREIYRFYREQGFGWMQFIPCLAPLDGAPEGGRVCAVAKDIRTFSDGGFRLLARGSETGRVCEHPPHGQLDGDSFGRTAGVLRDGWSVFDPVCRRGRRGRISLRFLCVG